MIRCVDSQPHVSRTHLVLSVQVYLYDTSLHVDDMRVRVDGDLTFNKEQLAICLRPVDDNLVAHEEFITYLKKFLIL